MSRAQVFEGKVELRVRGGGNSQADSVAGNRIGPRRFQPRRLGDGGAAEGRQEQLLREMPKSVPITLFNTGVGLKPGDPDPHWQIVSRSDDPTFKPRPAG